MADEAVLLNLFDTLRHHWVMATIAIVGIFGGATIYAENLPDSYEASVVLAFAPRPEVGVSADTVRLVTPKYVAYLTSAQTITRAAEDAELEPERLEGAVEARAEVDSGNVIVSVELESADEAAEVANALAAQAVAFAGDDDLVRGEIVAEALPPMTPSGPPRKMIEAAALLVGLLSALGLSLMVEATRPRLRTWTDLRRATGFNVLGRIPNSRLLRTRPTEALSDPAVGAAFRTLRANLEREWEDRTVDVISVVSPGPGEGKTTVAALFAESLARLGVKVLLIEADLRRPGLAAMLAMETEGGLPAVLRNEATVQGEAVPGWVPNLSVLPGKRDVDAGDLLARGFGDVLTSARSLCDVVIVDAPPVLGTDDARTIALLSKGVLLVVSSGSLSQPVNEAVLALEAVKAPVLGVIANRLRDSRANYT